MSSPEGICYKQPEPPPPTASCYICLENSTDSNNQPLLRNCACRGDAGWAHIACLTEFAASKVTEAQQKQDPSVTFESYWENCILCKTPHAQNVGLTMAEAFVKQYEHLPDTNELRLSSIYSLARGRYHVGNYDGAFEMFVRVQQICGVLTSMGVDVRRKEAQVLGMLGGVFLGQGKFNDAITTLERQRELLVASYGPNSSEIQDINRIIDKVTEALGIGGCGHTDPAVELVVARQKFKENQECVDIINRFYIHERLVDALRNDGKVQEGMEQLEKLLADSRQCLGPDHPDTLRYENKVNYYRQWMLEFKTPISSNSLTAGATTSQKKDVWAVIDCEQQPNISGQRVKVLRATKDACKYICLIKNDKGVSTKFKVTQNQLILETGTTVMVHGLVSFTDLNDSIGIIRSFDKEKRRYAVSVRKKKTSVSIKPINLNVVFTVPNFLFG